MRNQKRVDYLALRRLVIEEIPGDTQKAKALALGVSQPQIARALGASAREPASAFERWLLEIYAELPERTRKAASRRMRP